MSFFECKDIKYSYGKKRVLDGVSFELEQGEVAALLGANGSGKTTLIKAICSLLGGEGSVYLEKNQLWSKKEREIARLVSYIPQRSGIGISISVLDVVLMGFNARMGMLSPYTDAQRKEAFDALSKVGIGHMADRDYQSLSEGEKQLCILARSFVEQTKLMLFDEPESSLDFKNRYKVMSLLLERVEETGGAAIICLHEPSLAMQFCHRLIVIDEGKCIAQLHPKNDSLEKMEACLSRVYGDIKLHRIEDKLVMLPR